MHHTKFGWKPDIPDVRDYKYGVMRLPLEAPIKLPPLIDLRIGKPGMPGVYDQGELGSCTGNAIAGALEFNRRKQKIGDFVPSRLFIYYNERAAEGTINEDAGAYIRTGIKSVATIGYCHESIWPYNIDKFRDKPSAKAYTDAQKFKALTYYRLNNTDLYQLKACLAAGYPFIFGYALYKSFYDADNNNGVSSMQKHDDEMLGGHCVICVGYDDNKEKFIIRNSWGKKVGDKGYYYMPYQYLINPELSDDMWTIRSTT